MIDKYRKVYIAHIAVAVGNLTLAPRPDNRKIRFFVDAIINLAEKSDEWIANNQKQFDDILNEAKEINNRH